MSASTSLATSARSALLVTCLATLASVAAAASGESPPAGTPPAGSLTASPAASAQPPSSSPAPLPAAALHPLPPQVATIPPDIPTVSLTATSTPSLEIGVMVSFELGHCGLLSPVDIDGSLWQPVAGHDAAGEPIDSDEEIGELINATPGMFILLTPDSAEFRSPSGVIVAFERAEGALDYPLCM